MAHNGKPCTQKVKAATKPKKPKSKPYGKK